MHRHVGVVLTIIGDVVATSFDAMGRALKTGDYVFLNDVITTSNSGAIGIVFHDNSDIALGRDSIIVIDKHMFPDGIPDSRTPLTLN